ncbi:MAG TPA: FAD synthetase family protein [Chloroflexota bacterium]|jgi:riboflavin kinase/FMN adenylyltransferase|nr:FAD synthetase family protein [Chloroflexota bacterium]
MKSESPAIVTIGNFDGVHLGHQQLIGEAVDRARRLGLCSMAITFDPHPEQVLFPERRQMYLSTPEERLEVLRATGIDQVWICPFTTELARLEPAEFMRMVADRQPLAELWVGADFALGRGRQGTISVLSELGSAAGWALHVVPPYRLLGQVVSSTAIRTLLAAGAVRGAADLLGRPYSVRGDLSGSEFTVDPQRALPRQGSYEAQLHHKGATRDVRATVPTEPGRILLQGDVAATDTPSPATLTFLRRAD